MRSRGPAGGVVSTLVFGAAVIMAPTEARSDVMYHLTPAGPLAVDERGYTSYRAYSINSAGDVVGTMIKFEAGQPKGDRAFLWPGRQGAGTELQGLEVGGGGYAQYSPSAVNNVGVIVGSASRYATGDSGIRAVRWAPGSVTPEELEHLGKSATGVAYAVAKGVDAAGNAVGNSSPTGNASDVRAVRWAAGSTAASLLGDLGEPLSHAESVTPGGTVVGWANKPGGLGQRAVRWDAGSNQAVELGHLGTNPAGVTDSSANGANDAGVIVGSASKYDGGTFLGSRAVRWEAGSRQPTELGHLWTNAAGFTYAGAAAVNSAGDAVGAAAVDVDAFSVGTFHAVLWPAGTTTAIDLNDVIDLGPQYVLAHAWDVNDDGTIVGQGWYFPNYPNTAGFRDFGFILTPVPEPAGAAAVSLGCAALLRRGRRAPGRA
jgi:hypothetical protein